MGKFEDILAHYQEDTSNRLYTVGTSIEKLVEGFSIIEKSLKSKADASQLAQLEARVVGLEMKTRKVEAQLTTHNEQKRRLQKLEYTASSNTAVERSFYA